jgi:hypothetical protein
MKKTSEYGGRKFYFEREMSSLYKNHFFCVTSEISEDGNLS